MQTLDSFMDKPDAPIHSLMKYELVDEDNNDANVPDFFFSESYSNTDTKNEGQVVTNFEDFAKEGSDDFISKLATDNDFWFDDSQFDNLDLKDFSSDSDWEMPSLDNMF